MFKQFLLGVDVQTVERSIDFSKNVTPENFMNNLVRNQKYSVFTFIPRVLYDQFKLFFNMFFLLITLS